MAINRWERKETEKICSLDIDGILNYYPEPWVNFLNSKLCTNFSSLNEAKDTVPYQVYKNIKYEYRESGVKATLQIRPEAVELTRVLKASGFLILIITSRPFSEHKSLHKQTTDWLANNGIQYDGIVFGLDKYIEVLQKAPNLRFLADDHRYYCNLVSRWGYQTYLLDNPYNQGALHPNCTRVYNLLEIIDYEDL